MVIAQLLSRYAISLTGARPVLPVGRVTIEPSYEPLFGLESVQTCEAAARDARSFRCPRFSAEPSTRFEPGEKHRVVADSCPDGAVALRGDRVDRVERETGLYYKCASSSRPRCASAGVVKMCMRPRAVFPAERRNREEAVG